MQHRTQRRAWVAFFSAVLAGVSLVPLSAAPVAAAATGTLPPVRHIWVLELENTEYSALFGAPGGNNPYLSQTLPSEGAILPFYFGIGHNSLDNYIAEVSGQAPNPQTQQDCTDYTAITPTVVDTHGQVVGQGCEYPNRAPATVLTLADQLQAAGLSWKGYLQDMGQNLVGDGATACAHPAAHQTPEGYPNPQSDDGSSNYVVKHNPFAYFDSLIDHDADCRQHVVPLDPDLRDDLTSVATTPNFSLIVPTVTWDGHDSSTAMEPFARKYVSMITASPAFRQDGMLVVTFDEGSGLDASACCNEIPGPNSPNPGGGGANGGAGGAGGSQVGAVVLSPFVKPGTVVMPATVPQAAPGGVGPACTPASCAGPGFYNHYSLLRSVEDLLGLGKIAGVPSTDGLGHLGFAGDYPPEYKGPGEFGCEVFTAYPNCALVVGSPAVPPPSAGATGPRGRSPVGTPTWSAPALGGADLRALACPTPSVCLTAGASGTAAVSTDGGSSWTPIASGTSAALNAIACTTATTCLAVGDAGALLRLTSGESGWSAVGGGLPTGSDMHGLSCLDATNCVAVGNNTIVSTTDAGLTWSAPSSLALPALAPGSTPDLLGVSCAVSTTPAATACYAVGSVLNTAPAPGVTLPSAQNVFKSTNPFAGAAATWTPQQVLDGGNSGVKKATGAGTGTAARLRAVTCADATHCVVTGESSALATTVDGSTWNDQSKAVPPLSIPPTGQTFTQSANTEFYNAITCPVGGPTVQCVAVGGRPTLAGSTNMTIAQYATVQAATMATALGTPGTAATAACAGPPASDCNTAILEQPGTRDELNAVVCPGLDECVAVGDGGTVVRTTAAFPAASNPAWTANFRDSSITWATAAGNIEAPFYGIACASATDCAAVGGGSPQLAAADTVLAETGPAQWTTTNVPKPPVLASQAHQTGPPPPPTDAGGRLAAVTCPAAGQCLAVGTTGWIATLADGAWTSKLVDPTGQTVVPPTPNGEKNPRGVVPTEDLQAVSCAPATALDGDTCVAVGDRGAVLTSTDGGANWAVTGNGSTPFTTATLNGVSCPNVGQCIAVGATGTVLALTNAGGTWSATPVPSSTAQLLSAVSCPGPTSCVVAGSGGTILTLSRGLSGWTAASRGSGVGDELYGVSCASTTICAAAGANGTVLSTVDGGATWTALGTGTDVAFRSVSCPSVTTCYASGDAGAVLRTTTPVTGSLAVTLSLSPAQVSTDGGTTTATVTVTRNGTPDPDATVSLARTGTGAIGAVTDHGDGTYTAQLSASSRVGVETVTAQAVDGALSASTTSSLTDVVGVPAAIALVVDPTSIHADGTATARATATVTDAHQNVVAGETVAFASDGNVAVGPASATTDANGVATSTITASKTVGIQTISATDSARALTAHKSLTLLATSVAPTNVVASPADDSAVVSWTAATPADGDTLTDYVVTPTPAGPGPVTVPSTATSTTVPGLTNGTAYTFTVTAEFGSGNSSTSSPSGSVTPFGEPSVPGSVTAVAGDATADVNWVKSDPNGSPIRGYTVTASPGGAQVVVPAAESTAHFTGLTNGTSYTFTVTAHNAAEGVTSEPSAAVVPKFGTALHVPSAQQAIIGGQTGTVHGTLVRNRLPLRGAHVTIAARPAGATSYARVATVTTGGSGQWSLAVRPARNTSYRITFPGDAADRSATAVTSMAVHAQVHVASPRNGATVPGGYLTVSATTRYAGPGTKAWLQYRRGNGTWAQLAFARVGKDGRLSFVASLRRGTHWLRLYVAGTATNAAASTKPFVLYLS